MSPSTFDDPVARRVDARLNSKEFDELLRSLEQDLNKVRSKRLTPDEVETLRGFITTAVLVFYGLESHASNLAQPIEDIIRLLRTNQGDVLVALGAPTPLFLSSDDARINKAMNRYKALIKDLNKIADAAPMPAEKRKQGGQVRTRDDIFWCATVLAICWGMLSGEPFTQSWLTRKESKLLGSDVRVPRGLSGAMLVFDVIKFLDPDRLDQVPKVTEKLRTDWLNAEKQVSRK